MSLSVIGLLAICASYIFVLSYVYKLYSLNIKIRYYLKIIKILLLKYVYWVSWTPQFNRGFYYKG